MKKVFISGNFNILHPGHIRLFKFAKEIGAYLIVGVFCDKLIQEKNFIPEQDRLDSLKSISLIDKTILITDSLKKILNHHKPDIVLKGKEHENHFNQELSIIKNFNGKLIFASGMSTLSSINLLHKELSNHTNKIDLPINFLKRHKLSKKTLRQNIEKFKKLKICVIGDLIIDEYINCNPLGMSQEDPTIVVTPSESKKFIGGSGIVAAHAAGLGANVEYITVAGKDDLVKYTREKLSQFNVNHQIFIDDSRPTTLKQRFRSNSKTLLRVSHLQQHTISNNIQLKIIKSIKKIIKSCDLLMFSDFNYGCLPQVLVEKIINIAKQNNVIIAADSQSSSQTGNIGRFQLMDLIVPTEREARISLRNNEDGLVVIANKILEVSRAKYLILKLGEEGVLIEEAMNEKKSDIFTDRLEALNKRAIDVAGGGDSLFVGSALSLVSGSSIWEAALIGSIMSSIQVGRIGNVPIKSKELLEAII